jgi:hypothetical protein
MRAVSEHAEQLGRTVASDDLFLLALSDLPDEGPATRALAKLGVNSETLLPHIRTTGDGNSRPVGQGLTFSPAYYTFDGLAHGFSASLGDGQILPEHVLLAILWTGRSQSLAALRALGVSREAIVRELSQLGVPVPQSSLPPLVEVDWGERVWFERDQTRRVLDHVRLHLGPHTRWGFNYDGDRAWVHAERSIDVEALVQEALSDE